MTLPHGEVGHLALRDPRPGRTLKDTEKGLVESRERRDGFRSEERLISTDVDGAFDLGTQSRDLLRRLPGPLGSSVLCKGNKLPVGGPEAVGAEFPETIIPSSCLRPPVSPDPPIAAG